MHCISLLEAPDHVDQRIVCCCFALGATEWRIPGAQRNAGRRGRGTDVHRVIASCAAIATGQEYDGSLGSVIAGKKLQIDPQVLSPRRVKTANSHGIFRRPSPVRAGRFESTLA